MSLKFNLVKRAHPLRRDEFMWYATTSSAEPLTGKSMTRAATANTSIAAVEMESALEHLAAYIPQQLLQGHTVKVPGLGTFRITFKSEGVNDVSQFNAGTMIKDARIVFIPCKELRKSVVDNLTYTNNGVLDSGVRYASITDYRRAMGLTDTPDTEQGNTDTPDTGTDNGNGSGEGNPF